MRGRARLGEVGVAAAVVLLLTSLAPSVVVHPSDGSTTRTSSLTAPDRSLPPLLSAGPAVRPLPTGELANSQTGALSASISLLSGAVAHGPVPFTAGDGPVSIAADPSNGRVYVVDQTSGNLAVLNASTGAFVKWIPVGFWPTSIAYDGINHGLFVTHPLTLDISVLNSSGLAVAGTINYVDGPSSVTVDYTNNSTGSLVVTGQGTHAAFWIGQDNLTTFWSTDPSVPDSPYLSDPVEAVAVQPSLWPSSQLLVADFATASLEEFCSFHEFSQYFWTACAAPAVGSHPDSLVYDRYNQHVYVANAGSNNVSVLAAHVAGTTVTMPVWSPIGSIHVGTSPSAIAFDPHNGELFVVNQGSDNVTVIDGATDKVLGSVPVGSEPDALSFDPANDHVYVANYLSDNVSVFSAANFTSLIDRLSVRTAYVPVSLAVEGRGGSLAVLSSDSNQIVQLNRSTDGLEGGGTLTLTGWKDPGPGSLVYDPVNHLVYGVQVSTSGVLLLNGSGTLNLPTGTGNIAVAFDPVGTPVVYVINQSGGVLVLNGSGSGNPVGSGTLVLGNGSVGGSPDAVGIDLASGVAYIADGTANVVTAVRWSPFSGVQILGSVGVGSGPDGVAFDPSNGYLYVVDERAHNVTVLAPTPANPVGAVVGTIPVGPAPSAIAFDPMNGCLYVASSASDNLTVINGSTDTVVGRIFVGGSQTAVVVGPNGEEIYTDLKDRASLAVVSVAKYPVTFEETGLPPGTNWSVTLGSATGSSGSGSLVIPVNNGSFSFVSRLMEESGIFYYFKHTSSGHQLVTVQGGPPTTVQLSFAPVRAVSLRIKEVGLPAGTTWGASVGAVAQTNRTVATSSASSASSGLLSFVEPPGTVNFSLVPPSGYGIAALVGGGHPNETSANLTRATTWTVKFGAVRDYAFGLNPNPKFQPFVSTNWSGTLCQVVRVGWEVCVAFEEGDPDRPIVTGAVYKWSAVDPDSYYQVAPAGGHFRVGTLAGRPLTTDLRFYERTWAKVFFNMSGLSVGSDWWIILVGGPSGTYKFPYAIEAKPGKMGIPVHVKQIEILLPVGTYKWFALATATGRHVGGTLTVSLPGPDWVPVVL